MKASPSTEQATRSAQSAEKLAGQLLLPEDQAFILALREAGLLGELCGDELLRVAHALEDREGLMRRMDLLELYYRPRDLHARERRCSQDRFFILRQGEPTTASHVVARIAEVVPELGTLVLERIGQEGDDGQWVIRAAERVSPVLGDDDVDPGDTIQMDVHSKESSSAAPTDHMLTVRGLVRAANQLLEHAGVRTRLIALRSDSMREVYLGLELADAITLSQEGFLEDDEADGILELGCW